MIEGRIHFVGIGGIGMSAIARVLLQRGCAVSGTDAKSSPLLDRLGAEGANVRAGHAAEAVADADLVVVSSAVPDANAEIVAARERGIPIIKRAEMLGRLTREARSVLVAGTHGKTTTSAMIGVVLLRAGVDPTLLIGGEVVDLDTNGRNGSGAVLVAEADEFDGSFLRMQPSIAVVTNVEADHLDYYGDMASLRGAFRHFLALVPPNGCQVVGSDLSGAVDLVSPSSAVLTYAVDTAADWRPASLRLNSAGCYEFEAHKRGVGYATVSLRVPGRHNVANALAACAVAERLAVAGDIAGAALSAFRGARRRFEAKGGFGGALLFDDYAHHPTEIRATLRAARERFPDRRLVVVFQPHTYSRTKHLLDEFAHAFGDADFVLLADIYASRERDEWGVSTGDLFRAMAGQHVEYPGDLDAVEHRLREVVAVNDVVFTLGAGDVHTVAERLAEGP